MFWLVAVVYWEIDAKGSEWEGGREGGGGNEEEEFIYRGTSRRRRNNFTRKMHARLSALNEL